MKKTIIGALAALSLVACNKEADRTQAITEPSKPVDISFSLAGNGSTKASKTAAEAKESAVNNFQIFVFNTDGTLDAAGYQTGSSDITLKCSSGTGRTVYALVNHSSDITSSVATEKALKEIKSNLSDNAVAKGLVMYGKKSGVTIDGTKVVVPVNRLCGKIYIDEIRNSLKPALGKITLNGIYVINATNDVQLGDTTYCPDAANWYNKRKYETVSGRVDSLLYEGFTGVEIANAGKYQTPCYLYAYPNPTTEDTSVSTFSARYSRLVIDVTVENDKDENGVQIPHRYYPINLVQDGTPVHGIERNKYYHITYLNISRLGSLDPDWPISTSDVQFNITVNAWTLGFEKNIEL